MTDTLTLERVFTAPLELVFDFVTKRENLTRWWGHEGMTLPEEMLDFSRTGAWFSVMKSPEGKTYKVSGQVTKVAAPNLVAFTWGWHDETDDRGRESHVMIELSDLGDGKTKLVLSHRDLPDDQSRDNHRMGWTSFLRNLEAALS